VTPVFGLDYELNLSSHRLCRGALATAFFQQIVPALLFLILELLFSAYKRKIRFCPYCNKYIINIYYHRKKRHPDKSANDFHYDTKAKCMGVGPYVNYKGYFCPKCKTARSDLDKHYANRHKHVDQTTERYKRMRDANVIDFTNWTTVLQKFESDLITDGGGTGNPCSKADAHRYHKQILKLIPHKETLRDFLGVFENLQNAVDKSKDGYISTQHAYVVTLLKFLRYLRSRNYDVVTKTYLQNFTERAKQWKKGLRMKRKKREEQFNLKESVELTDEVDPFTAILRYERSTFHNEICSYRNDHHTNTDAKKLRLVYADIFARII